MHHTLNKQAWKASQKGWGCRWALLAAIQQSPQKAVPKPLGTQQGSSQEGTGMFLFQHTPFYAQTPLCAQPSWGYPAHRPLQRARKENAVLNWMLKVLTLPLMSCWLWAKDRQASPPPCLSFSIWKKTMSFSPRVAVMVGGRRPAPGQAWKQTERAHRKTGHT